METWTPEGGVRLGSILFRIPQLVWLVSIFDFQDPLKADPTREPLLTKVAPRAPETAPSARASSQLPVAAAPISL